MKTRTRIVFMLMLVMYGSLTAFFFFLHFSSREQVVLHDFKGLELYGYFSKLKSAEKDRPLELGLKIGLLNISFSDKTPLLCEFAGGIRQRAMVGSYSSAGQKFAIVFDNGVEMLVGKSSATEFTVEFAVKGVYSLKDLVRLELPLNLSSGALIPGMDGLLYSSEFPGGLVFLTLPGFRKSVYEHNVLSLEKGGEPVSLVFELSGPGVNPMAYWLSKSVSAEGNEKALSAYLDRAYKGWMESRFNGATGLWEVKSREPAFSEKIGCGLLAESITRGDYTKALYLVNLAVSMELSRGKPGIVPSLTTCYMGKIEPYLRQVEKEDAAFKPEIEKRITASDPALLSIDGLVKKLLDRGNILSLDDFIGKVVVNTDTGQKAMDAYLSMTRMYLDITRYLPEKTGFFSSFKAIPPERILPAVIRLKDGLFLADPGNGNIEALRTIRAGRLLIDYGKSVQDGLYETVGAGLIGSILKMSDEQGYVPERLTVNGDLSVTRQGLIAPEELYPEITQAAHFPKEVPLYPALVPGTWLWTIAQLKKFEVSGNRITLVLSFPPDSRHYFFIRKLGPVKSVTLHGKTAYGGADYFNYPQGAYYDYREYNTLLVKLKHAVEDEEVVIEL